MEKVLNDHVAMVSRNGAKKPIPIWKIIEWIAGGTFSLETAKDNMVGYDFEDHAKGVADVKAWNEYQKLQRAKKIARSRTPQKAEGGFADAQFNLNAPPAESGKFSSVPSAVPGSEKIDKGPAPPIEPKDMI